MNPSPIQYGRLVLRAESLAELAQKIAVMLDNGNGTLKSCDIGLWFDSRFKIIHFEENVLRDLLRACQVGATRRLL